MKKSIFKSSCIAIVFTCLIIGDAYGGRTNKMFDVPQTKRPEWGANWCAPTAVGNSFAWLAKEYPELAGLAKVNGNGAAKSAEDIIDDLGKNYMSTSPTTGTTAANILKGKTDYIKAHGLEAKITIETQQNPTKKWVKEQYDKGQDIELGLGYYEKDDNGKWQRVGGHVQTYGYVPGESVGGHTVSLSDIFDPYDSDEDTDFEISFTDPGRDDLTGDYGAIDHDQYWLTDYAGIDWYNTESTYNLFWEPDLFDIGQGGYILNGYQGVGDFGRGDAVERDTMTYVEIAWAESPIPEPCTFLLLGLGGLLIRKRK